MDPTPISSSHPTHHSANSLPVAAPRSPHGSNSFPGMPSNYNTAPIHQPLPYFMGPPPMHFPNLNVPYPPPPYFYPPPHTYPPTHFMPNAHPLPPPVQDLRMENTNCPRDIPTQAPKRSQKRERTASPKAYDNDRNHRDRYSRRTSYGSSRPDPDLSLRPKHLRTDRDDGCRRGYDDRRRRFQDDRSQKYGGPEGYRSRGSSYGRRRRDDDGPGAGDRRDDRERQLVLMSNLDAIERDADEGKVAHDIRVKRALPRIPTRYRRDFLETAASGNSSQARRPADDEIYFSHDDQIASPNSDHEPLKQDERAKNIVDVGHDNTSDCGESHIQKTGMASENIFSDPTVPIRGSLELSDELKSATTTPKVSKENAPVAHLHKVPKFRKNLGRRAPTSPAARASIISTNLVFPQMSRKTQTSDTVNPYKLCNGTKDRSQEPSVLNVSLVPEATPAPEYASSEEGEIIGEEGNGEPGTGGNKSSNDLLYEGGGDVTMEDDEIFEMLEQPVDDASTPFVYKKSVMRAPDKDDFEVLPENWIEVTHNSGIPIYLHRGIRVCSLSRPYFLGLASVRKHSVPLGSVPCLNYKRFKERLAKEAFGSGCSTNNTQNIPVIKEGDHPPIPPTHDLQNAPTTSDAPTNVVPDSTTITPLAPLTICPAKFRVTVESAEDAKNRQWLTPAQLREYCERVFDFHTITVRKFKTWADRRKQIRKIKSNRPSLPKSAQIVKCLLPVQRINGQIIAKKKNFYFNPEDKTVLCVLHEYVQNVLKTQVQYTYCAVENTKHPFCSKLSIKGVEYGVGYGSNKKNAKLEAARVALSVLNPQISDIYNKSIESAISSQSNSKESALTCVKLLPKDSMPTVGYAVQAPKSANPAKSRETRTMENTKRNDGDGAIADGYEIKTGLPEPARFKSTESAILCHQTVGNTAAPTDLGGRSRPNGVDDSLVTPETKVAMARSRPSTSKQMIELSQTNTIERPKADVEDDEQLELFNELKIMDPRIAELSIKAGQPLPYALLLECLKRNFGLTDSNVQSELKTLKPSKHDFTLTVGKHSATVVCSSKREGKHRAAQQILQNIHPQVTNWGSILRLYGRNYTKDLLGRKMEQQSITSLQTQSKLEGPNLNILNKLKLEMEKLYERKRLIQPIFGQHTMAQTENQPTKFYKLTDLNI